MVRIFNSVLYSSNNISICEPSLREILGTKKVVTLVLSRLGFIRDSFAAEHRMPRSPREKVLDEVEDDGREGGHHVEETDADTDPHQLYQIHISCTRPTSAVPDPHQLHQTHISSTRPTSAASDPYQLHQTHISCTIPTSAVRRRSLGGPVRLPWPGNRKSVEFSRPEGRSARRRPSAARRR